MNFMTFIYNWFVLFLVIAQNVSRPFFIYFYFFPFFALKALFSRFHVRLPPLSTSFQAFLTGNLSEVVLWITQGFRFPVQKEISNPL